MSRAWITSSAFLIATGFTQAQPVVPPSSVELSLKKFLQNYDDGDDKTTRYLSAFVDLDGDGKNEAIVYLMGGPWCGSGGCPTLILVRNGVGWKILKYITITGPPIRVLSSTSHGWHDIGVWVQGGGIQPGYEAVLSFDRKTYPGNPSVSPARRLGRKIGGEIVIPSIEGGTPLYP